MFNEHNLIICFFFQERDNFWTCINLHIHLQSADLRRSSTACSSILYPFFCENVKKSINFFFHLNDKFKTTNTMNKFSRMIENGIIFWALHLLQLSNILVHFNTRWATPIQILFWHLFGLWTRCRDVKGSDACWTVELWFGFLTRPTEVIICL